MIWSVYLHRNSSELWNGLGQSHMQALAMAQDINAFFLVLLFGKFNSESFETGKRQFFLLEIYSQVIFRSKVTGTLCKRETRGKVVLQ